jgi:hypothetical protein
MRRRKQYFMFATLAGSKISLLITDVMSSNSWIFVSCGMHFQLVSLSFNISSISWSIGFLTSSNRLQSRMKCSIFSLSLLHSKQSIFASFLNIFIWLLWSMYEPVSSLSLVGSLWRSPFELQLIFNIGCSFPFSRLTQLKYRRPFIIWSRLYNRLASKFMYFPFYCCCPYSFFWRIIYVPPCF